MGNTGRIHYTGASNVVVKAYADEDVETFLKCRAQEISGGMIVMHIPGLPHVDVQSLGCIIFTIIESILIDIVKEVCITYFFLVK